MQTEPGPPGERRGEVKQNKSNSDETELMCHDQRGGGEVCGVSVTTATHVIINCLSDLINIGATVQRR